MPELVRITPVEEVKGALVGMRESFTTTLPKHIDPDKFLTVAQMAIVNNPDLASKCDRQSLYVAFTLCAQDGLIPDGREAALIPFKGKAKYIPMVAGICKKARNSGEVSVIDSQVVYENDTYESWIDEKGPHFKHRKKFSDRGKVVLTYAYAILKDGGVAFEEIDEEQMAKIEQKSSAGDSPWKGPFKDEMRRKSAIRRLAKYRLPNSSDLDPLLKQDDEIYDEPEVIQEAKEEKTEPSRLAKTINAQATVIDDSPSAQAAAQEAKKVFPNARDVKAKPEAAKPAESTALEVKGKIGHLKVKEGVGARGPWCRFGIKIGEKYYGSFDKEIGENMQKAVDLDANVIVRYTERTDNKNQVFRDILTFEYEEGEPVPEDEVPI